MNGFDVDDLLALRAPGVLAEAPGRVVRDGAGLEHLIAWYADALRRIGADVLRGDFAVFRDLAARAAPRVRGREREGATIGPDGRALLDCVDAHRDADG